MNYLPHQTYKSFTVVVYGYGQISVCGGSRGIGPLHVTGSDVTGPDRK
jgi:hypothetical protein